MNATGFLHPGSMGAALAATCSGPTYWVSAGRTSATAGRATAAGMTDAGALEALAAACDVIVSICPPHAALDVATAVADTGFDGIFVDANAIAPATVRRVAEQFDRFVDGSVIGPPPVREGTTRLYLAGPDADSIAARWSGSPLAVHTLDGEAGSASALKMAYAGWTKGTAALLMALVALAEADGVADALFSEWAVSQPDLVTRSRQMAGTTATRAWRWEGEMREIASTFAASGLPDGFHLAAADIYGRLATFEGADPAPALEQVVAELLGDAP